MSEQTPQPPQEEQLDDAAPTAHDSAPAADASSDTQQAPQLSYHEYLKFTNPGKSDEEIAKMIRKENRYTWLVRFQILAIIVFLILILVFIFVR